MLRTLSLPLEWLGQDYLLEVLGLQIAESFGPLIMLEMFLLIANKLLQVTDAGELPAIQQSIKAMLERVNMLNQSEGEVAVYSDDGLNRVLYETASYLYYRKCIELRKPLEKHETIECANLKSALAYGAPIPHYSFSPVANLIFSIVLVSREVCEFPTSLDNVEYARIQEYVMSVQVILAMAANHIKQSRQENGLDADVRRGLSCMLTDNGSTDNTLDQYAKGLAKLAYARVKSWCASIKKRRESMVMQGMDSLFHYEEVLATTCSFLNYQEDSDFQKQVDIQRNKFMPFDQQDHTAAEAYFQNLLVQTNKRCEQIEKIMESIIHNRTLEVEGTMTWQRITTNALNVLYMELLAARVYLQTSAIKFSNHEVAVRVERDLYVFGLIYATAIIDAIPRQNVSLTIFNRLWLLLEVAREPTDAEFKEIIHFGAASHVMTALVSTWLVSKVTCHLTANGPELRSSRKSIFESLLYRLWHLFKLANDCVDEKKKNNINQIALDFYFYLLKFASSPEENLMVMTDELQKRIGTLTRKSAHAKRYQFLFDMMRALKADGKTASDLTREVVAKLERKDKKIYDGLFKTAREAFRDLDFYDKRMLNYHVQIDFVMFSVIFFAKTPKGNRVNSVKLDFYRHDLTHGGIRLIKELAIDAIGICGAKLEMIEAPLPPKQAAEPKAMLDEEQRKANRASFLPAENKQPIVARRGKQKKLSSQSKLDREGSIYKLPVPPTVSANFEDFEKFFAEDYAAISTCVQEQMASPKMTDVDKYSALVKLTHCLEKLKDPVLAAYIQEKADRIFQEVKKFITDRTELNEDRAYVYGVLAKMELDECSDKSDICSSNTLSESNEEDIDESDLDLTPPAVTTVASTMYARAPTSRQQRKAKFSLQQILDSYKPPQQSQPARFPFTNGQWKIMQRLKECAHHTFVHGSSVISLLRGAPVTDIDLLCFVDAIQLQQYLVDHQDELGISWSSIDMNNQQILHVYLKEKKPNGDPVKMEFACHGNLSDREMLKDMRSMLISYYLSNMFADPYNGNFIDFYHQHEWIVERNKITSVVREPKSAVKFYESPLRMIELIIRIAYFNSHGKPFKTTYDLRTGVIINADQLEFNAAAPERTINNIKWEKLFVRGHAKLSFDELVFFDLFRVLFPAFDKMTFAETQKIGEMFAEFDKHIKSKYKYELTDEQNGKECLELLMRIVICYLDIKNLKSKLCKNKTTDELRDKIKFVLTGVNYMSIDKLIPTVQSMVIKRLFNLDKQPKRKAVSPLFVAPNQTQAGSTSDQVKNALK